MIYLIYTIALALLVGAEESTFPIQRRQNSFSSCVSGLGDSDLTVLTSSSPDYQTSSQAFNLRFSFTPQAILFPTSAKEVSQIVGCASQSNLSVSTRSGGHSYAAYALAGDVVLDMSKMRGLQVSADGTAVIQTGNRLGEVAQGLWNQGKRALPHGSCPYVGTGGHAAFGGYGFFSRVAGLLQDNIKSAEVVLANGTIATASTTQNPDLFFAIRGAGPSFGVVTAWTFNTLAAPTSVIDFKIDFPSLSKQDYTTALIAFQTFGQNAPNELATQLVTGPSGSGASLSFQGDYYGELDAFHTLIDPWIKTLPGSPTLNAKQLKWLDSLVAKDGALSVTAPDSHDTFFAKSLLISQPSSNDSLAAWANFIYTTGVSSKIGWFAEIDSWGGAISKADQTTSSFSHRDAIFGYQLYSSSSNNQPPYPQSQIDFLNQMWATLAGSNTASQYTNYIDPTLSADVWPQAYFPGTFDKLTQIKSQVDPGNTFRFAQSIPLSSKSGSSSPGGGSSSPSSPSSPSGGSPSSGGSSGPGTGTATGPGASPSGSGSILSSSPTQTATTPQTPSSGSLTLVVPEKLLTACFFILCTVLVL